MLFLPRKAKNRKSMLEMRDVAVYRDLAWLIMSLKH